MSEEDSKSKKRKPKTVKGLTVSLSGAEIALPEHLENVLKEALVRFDTAAESKNYKLKDLEHLDNIAQEFLRTFIILGYDINGEKVHIFHAETPHDRDALVEHLRTTLINIINNNDN
jgi:hypothetical protein